MSRPIRVLVVDDHRMFGEALDLLIGMEAEFEVMGSVRSGEEALERCRRVCPDVILMDIELPGIDGIRATAEVKMICPDAQVVVMTAYGNRSRIVRAIQAGAVGFLPKTQAADVLVSVIKRAAEGEMILPAEQLPSVLASLQEHGREYIEARFLLDQLSSREREVLQTLAQGKSSAEISRELYIQPQTVQSHVKNILTKLGVHSKLAAALFAIRYGAFEDLSEVWTRPAQESLWNEG
jgi:NarL family two-component system response regulator LiaR